MNEYTYGGEGYENLPNPWTQPEVEIVSEEGLPEHTSVPGDVDTSCIAAPDNRTEETLGFGTAPNSEASSADTAHDSHTETDATPAEPEKYNPRAFWQKESPDRINSYPVTTGSQHRPGEVVVSENSTLADRGYEVIVRPRRAGTEEDKGLRYPGRIEILNVATGNRALLAEAVWHDEERPVPSKDISPEGRPERSDMPQRPFQRSGTLPPDEIRIDELPEDRAEVADAVEAMLRAYTADTMNRMTTPDETTPGIVKLTHGANKYIDDSTPLERQVFEDALVGQQPIGITRLQLSDPNSNLAAYHADFATPAVDGTIDALARLHCEPVSITTGRVEGSDMRAIEITFRRKEGSTFAPDAGQQVPIGDGEGLPQPEPLAGTEMDTVPAPQESEMQKSREAYYFEGFSPDTEIETAQDWKREILAAMEESDWAFEGNLDNAAELMAAFSKGKLSTFETFAEEGVEIAPTVLLTRPTPAVSFCAAFYDHDTGDHALLMDASTLGRLSAFAPNTFIEIKKVKEGISSFRGYARELFELVGVEEARHSIDMQTGQAYPEHNQTLDPVPSAVYDASEIEWRGLLAQDQYARENGLSLSVQHNLRQRIDAAAAVRKEQGKPTFE